MYYDKKSLRDIALSSYRTWGAGKQFSGFNSTGLSNIVFSRLEYLWSPNAGAIFVNRYSGMASHLAVEHKLHHHVCMLGYLFKQNISMHIWQFKSKIKIAEN